MDQIVEHEICANCKKEIPHYNYVMHTAHCARNFSLCQVCKEPVSKNEMENHRKKHTTNVRGINEKLDFPRQVPRASSEQQQPPPARSARSPRTQNGGFNFEAPSSYSLGQGSQYAARKLPQESPIRSEYSFPRQTAVENAYGGWPYQTEKKPAVEPPPKPKPKSPSLLPCKYCDLELPKLDLQDHENYCGARTDKCNECGEIVMYRYKKLHEETNHGFLKLNDEPGPRATWDSDTQRPVEPSYARRQRPAPIYTVNSFDFSPLYSSYNNYSSSSLASESNGNEKKETYKDISRRLDCKTEYIRNLLHDSASITVPLRRNGITPRNHFNHNKGPAPQPPPQRRPNPPTELLIPCEFCHTPIPHEELIQHETGCRPDLARFNPRRRSPSPDDDYFVPPTPSSPEVELPCEFCADMFPASELLRHQLTCS